MWLGRQVAIHAHRASGDIPCTLQGNVPDVVIHLRLFDAKREGYSGWGQGYGEEGDCPRLWTLSRTSPRRSCSQGMFVLACETSRVRNGAKWRRCQVAVVVVRETQVVATRRVVVAGKWRAVLVTALRTIP